MTAYNANGTKKKEEELTDVLTSGIDQQSEKTAAEDAAQRTEALTTAAYQQSAFEPSEALKGAQTALEQYQSTKPGAYQSAYGERIQELYNQIMNQPAFEYSFDADPLYQQYKDQYVQGGQRAMQDAMAGAAALTGGYGNSYAATAGNLAYQQYMSGLNEAALSLEERAYGRYQDEADRLKEALALVQGMEEDAYGRYRDEVSDWQTGLDYETGRYDTAYNREYAAYQDQVAQGQFAQQMAQAAAEAAQAQKNYEQEFSYQQAQDALAQKNYESEWAYQQAQDALAQKNYEEELAWQKLQAELAQKNYESEWAYKQAQDALAQENYETEWAWNKYLDELEYGLTEATGSSGSGTSGSTSSGQKTESAASATKETETEKPVVSRSDVQEAMKLAEKEGGKQAMKEVLYDVLKNYQVEDMDEEEKEYKLTGLLKDSSTTGKYTSTRKDLIN